MANYLDNDIKFVAGVGEARARLLEKELGIRTLGDMLFHYPFRYIDRTRIYRIDQIAEGDSALIQFRSCISSSPNCTIFHKADGYYCLLQVLKKYC